MIWLSVLGVLLIAGLLISARSANSALVEPVFWISLSFFYYFFASPLWLYYFHDGNFYGRSFALDLKYGAALGVVAYTSILLGYIWARRFKVGASTSGVSIDVSSTYAWFFFLAAVLAYMAFLSLTGLDFVLFASEDGAGAEAKTGTGSWGYLYACINLFIPSLTLLGLSSRTRGDVFFLLTIVLALVFAAIGFRFRILILLAVALSISIHRGWMRASLFKLFLIGGSLLIAMGAVAQMRSYRGGLDLARLEDVSFLDLLSRAFDEGVSVFATSSAVARTASSDWSIDPSPILQVLVHPIPRGLWPAKPYPTYLEDVPNALGVHGAEKFGAAMHASAEWLVIGSWVGVVIIGLLGGVVAGKLYRYFLGRCDEGGVALFILGPFLFYALSRGYLAQVVQDAAFIFIPLLGVSVARRIKFRPAS